MSTTMFGVCVPADADDEGDGEPGAWLSAAPLGAPGGAVGAVDSEGTACGDPVGPGTAPVGLAWTPAELAWGPLVPVAGWLGVDAGSLGLDTAPLVVAGAPLP